MSIAINGQVYPNNKVIVTKNNEVYKNPSTLGGIGAGLVGMTVASPVANLTKKPFAKMALAEINNLSTQGDLYKSAAAKAFENSGLANKGVELIDASKLSAEEISKITQEAMPKWINKLPEKVKGPVTSMLEAQIKGLKNGNNAAFIPNTNKILVSGEKMSGATFHEMGHALNKNTPGIGRVLAKLRQPGMILASAAVLIGAFKRKKAEGEEPKGIIDRTTTFVKNNAGKLAFAGFIPLLAEEGLASIKGAKMAKPLLSPEAYKNLNKMHGKAFLTYLGAAVCMGLAARTASWVHDKLSAPKRIA